MGFPDNSFTDTGDELQVMQLCIWGRLVVHLLLLLMLWVDTYVDTNAETHAISSNLSYKPAMGPLNIRNHLITS